MRKVLFLSILLFATTSLTVAGQNAIMSQQDYAEMQTSLMISSLNLTPEQAKEVLSINKRYAVQIQNAIDSNRVYINGQSHIQTLYNQKNAELRLVLTAKQYKTYLQIVQRAMYSIKENAPSPEDIAKQQTKAMAQELALSPAQIVKIEQINAQYTEMIQKIINMQSTENTSYKEMYLQLFDKKNSELQKVLTPLQYQKYLNWIQNSSYTIYR